MTATTPRSREDVEVTHPLDALTAADIDRARAVLDAAGRLAPSTRFASMLLREPSKDAVRAHEPGDTVPRRVEATLVDTASGAFAEALVDLDGDRIESWIDVDPTEAPYGQPPVLFEEYDRCADLVKADPRWQAALARRGVTDTSLTFVAPLSPGFFDRPGEKGRRILRGLTFLRDHVEDSPGRTPSKV